MATIKRLTENPSEVLENNQREFINTTERMKLSEMKQDEVNISAAQMLVLANSIVSGKEDMESIIASLEKQAWYKRMWNSFNGKMKGTAEEFAQNNGKLALYCVQAVSILVDNENFSTDMMLNIRQKLVNIYYFSTVQGIELLVGKEIVTEIRNSVSALINKVNSVTKQLDVLTILEADFETGKLDYDNHITTICGAISKLDNDILNDNSKLDIVRNYINESRIIDAPERSIEAFMYDIINVPAEMTGEVYLELATMSDNIWAEMFAELMESYNMLPKMERMAKKKDAIIKAILEKNDIDESAEFTSEDLFDSLLATRIEMAAMTGNVCIETNAVIENCEYIEEGEKRVPVGDNPVGGKAVMTVAEKAAEMVSEFFDCDVCDEYNEYEVENDDECDMPISQEVKIGRYSVEFIKEFSEKVIDITKRLMYLPEFRECEISADNRLIFMLKKYNSMSNREILNILSGYLGTDLPDYIEYVGEVAFYALLSDIMKKELSVLLKVNCYDIDRNFKNLSKITWVIPQFEMLEGIFGASFYGDSEGFTKKILRGDFYNFGELMDWIMFNMKKGKLRSSIKELKYGD